jgi:hypothetical protein
VSSYADQDTKRDDVVIEGGRPVIDKEKKKKEDSPPRSTPRRTRATALPTPPTLESRLVEFFGKGETTEDGFPYFTGIAGLASIVDPRDAMLIAGHGPTMAKAWADLADESPRVKRALEWLLTGGAWGGVFIATSPVVLGILANHNLLTRDMFGMGPATEENAEPVSDSTEQPGTAPRDPTSKTRPVG